MFGTGKSIKTHNRFVVARDSGKWERGVTANGYGASSQGGEPGLELDSGASCTTE